MSSLISPRPLSLLLILAGMVIIYETDFEMGIPVILGGILISLNSPRPFGVLLTLLGMVIIYSYSLPNWFFAGMFLPWGLSATVGGIFIAGSKRIGADIYFIGAALPILWLGLMFIYLIVTSPLSDILVAVIMIMPIFIPILIPVLIAYHIKRRIMSFLSGKSLFLVDKIPTLTRDKGTFETQMHPGIRIDKIPIQGGVGLVFAIGALSILLVGIPAIGGFLLIVVVGGVISYLWRSRKD